MQNRSIVVIAFAALAVPASAQLSPAITSWVINPGTETGYNGILSNVREVVYDNLDVYVGCAGIPGYSIGPWNGNPNDAGDQDWEFKITLFPFQNSWVPVNTPLGHIGVWTNGVTIFNPRDGMSYNMQGIWNQNAYYFEGGSFDACLGHPNQQMEYHTHINPTCLYDDTDSTQHSPIIGFAFDGFPIYGAYGYQNTGGTGPITRMLSNYRLRAITDRTTLPDGTVLNAGQYGPPFNAQYPRGSFIEDYEFVSGIGTLDVHNGRFCVTPEYPSGIYAYFVTLDADLEPAFPYVLGPTYYGLVPPGNTGPGSGHNTVPGGVTVYNPFTGVTQPLSASNIVAYPNPMIDELVISGLSSGTWALTMRDALGAVVISEQASAGAPWSVDVSALAGGTYILDLSNGAERFAQRVVVME
ncbi:MAG: YHYH protein [Flavobacteriales bacterium]|nr:YHYH protein [Flavobacteriales bacterium]